MITTKLPVGFYPLKFRKIVFLCLVSYIPDQIMHRLLVKLLALCFLLAIVTSDLSAKTGDAECEYIDKVNVPYGVHPSSVGVIPYNDNGIYFFASQPHRNLPEMWFYDTEKKDAIEFKEVHEALTDRSHPIVIGDKTYLQKFNLGNGMIEVDTNNRAVKNIESELNLLYTGYDSIHGLMVFTERDRQGTSYWGFNTKNSAGPFRLTQKIPKNKFSDIRERWIVGDKIIAFLKAGEEPLSTWVLNLKNLSNSFPLRTPDGHSIRLDRDPLKIGRHLYFRGETQQHGTELWKLDTTNFELTLVADIRSGAESGSPYNLRLIGKTIYFWARTDQHGIQLWSLDTESDEPAKTLTRFGPPLTGISSRGNIVKVGNSLFFEFTDSNGETALWSYKPNRVPELKVAHDFDPGVLAKPIDISKKDYTQRGALQYILSPVGNKLVVAVENQNPELPFDLWLVDPSCDTDTH